MSHTKGTGSVRVLIVIAKFELPFISFYGENLLLAGMVGAKAVRHGYQGQPQTLTVALL